MSDDLIAVLELSPIESHALKETVTSVDDRRKLFLCYLAMREKISCDYLPFINSAVPHINDHTRKHLRRVLTLIESILSRHFPADSVVRDIPADRLITWPDALILINALVWHDMGNMYGRKGHAKRVHECFQAVSGYMYDEYLTTFIKQVAEAHSGEGAIERIIPSQFSVGTYHQSEVHPQFLAAVLRFADELDEDYRRAIPQEWRHLNIIPRESHRYWYFCERNRSIHVRPIAGEHNLDLVVNIETHIPQSEFDQQFLIEEGKAETTSALAEYFRRIFKIEKERKYCNTFLRRAYYHPGIKGISVGLQTQETNAYLAANNVIRFELNDSFSPKDLLNRPDLSNIRSHIEAALGDENA